MRLEREFEFLRSLAQNGSHEEVRDEVEERLVGFLEAGLDRDEIMSMLGLEGVFNNYALLEEYGAEIDYLEIAEGLGYKFVYENLKEFSIRPIDMNLLAEEVFDLDSFDELCDTYTTEVVLSDFTYCGVCAETIFYLAGSVLEREAEYPEELIERLDFLVKHGLSRDSVKAWLSKRLKRNDFGLLRKCAFHYVNDLARFGIKITDFTLTYIENCGEDHLSNIAAMPLPGWLSINDLVKFSSMRQIIGIGKLDFIYEFEAQHGDMNMLAKKFIDTFGYPSEYRYAFVLLVIIENGGTEGVDLEKFAESVKTEELNAEDKRCFRETLSRCGVETGKLKKFI